MYRLGPLGWTSGEQGYFNVVQQLASAAANGTVVSVSHIQYDASSSELFVPGTFPDGGVASR